MRVPGTLGTGVWAVAAALGAAAWAACSYDRAGFAGGDEAGDSGDSDGSDGDPGDPGDGPGPADAAPPADAPTPPPPDAAPEPFTVRCTSLTPAALDGDFDDWGGVSKLQFDIDDAALLVDVMGAYAPSARVSFRCGHDADKIYLALEVEDDDLQVTTTDELYNDDSVAIYLDAAGDALGAFANDDHEIFFRPSGAPNYQDFGPGGPDLGLTGVVGPVGAGWVVEVGIEKSSLGVAGVLPTAMGFDLGIADQDGNNPSSLKYAYGVWHVSDQPACASCCAAEGARRPWCDTTMFARLVLE